MSGTPPPERPPEKDEFNVVPLGAEAVEGHGVAPPPSPPSSRLHGATIAGMALCALVGIGSMLAFVTVRWAGSTGRVVLGAVIISAVGFLGCAAAAVFTAARDTYAHKAGRDDGEEA